MGIKLGDISPVAGAITGKGIFGKIQKALGPTAGLLYQATQAKRDSDDAKESNRNFMKDNKFGSDGSYKKGGSTKKMASGGSASKRADGCATKGKTKGRFV